MKKILRLFIKVKGILRDQRGFSLAEIVVALAVVALLAAVITPQIVRYIDDARQTRAQADLRALAGAVGSFARDTGKYPVYSGTPSAANAITNATLKVLKTGGGSEPAPGTGITGWSDAAFGTIEDQLNACKAGAGAYPVSGNFRCRAPYLADVGPDPWGQKYFINVEFLQPGNIPPAAASPKAVFVLSAGPNQTVETAFSQDQRGDVIVGGDDLVFRIR